MSKKNREHNLQEAETLTFSGPRSEVEKLPARISVALDESARVVEELSGILQQAQLAFQKLNEVDVRLSSLSYRKKVEFDREDR